MSELFSDSKTIQLAKVAYILDHKVCNVPINYIKLNKTDVDCIVPKHGFDFYPDLLYACKSYNCSRNSVLKCEKRECKHQFDYFSVKLVALGFSELHLESNAASARRTRFPNPKHYSSDSSEILEIKKPPALPNLMKVNYEREVDVTTSMLKTSKNQLDLWKSKQESETNTESTKLSTRRVIPVEKEYDPIPLVPGCLDSIANAPWTIQGASNSDISKIANNRRSLTNIPTNRPSRHVDTVSTTCPMISHSANFSFDPIEVLESQSPLLPDLTRVKKKKDDSFIATSRPRQDRPSRSKSRQLQSKRKFKEAQKQGATPPIQRGHETTLPVPQNLASIVSVTTMTEAATKKVLRDIGNKRKSPSNASIDRKSKKRSKMVCKSKAELVGQLHQLKIELAELKKSQG
ncbi:hypothetical protein QAD02_014073 [Eretmocerus hayati]|uniref:Uncharacterized protein n=1 Tax=Eretmocerus hayati TaxID=131215 RepID=A0ACC2P5H7_9HYME|nr:hypothetical protein QAD02_014073 [Eretmocerus hayati]